MVKRSFCRHAKWVLLAACLVPASNLFAQANNTPASNKNGSFTLEPTIVTAEKREESLQDVLQSITAITGQEIRDANITNVQQAALRAPNVVISHFSVPRLSFPFIRGIGSGRNSPAVTTYIDGVPQLSFATSNIELVDIDRIEFLRGPQGTLYGRNTLGGVINIYTRQPTNTFYADLQTTFGSYNTRDYRAAVSGPIVKDKFYYAVAGGFSGRDGYSKNLFTGNDIDDRNDFFGRASLIYTPTERLTLNLTVNGERDRDGDYALEDLATINAHPRRVNRDFEGNTRRDVQQAAFTATYHGDGVDFTSISAYQAWNSRDRTDLDYTPADFLRRQSNDGEHNLVEEMRLNSPNDKPVVFSKDAKLKWLVGALAFRQDNKHFAAQDFRPDAVPVFGLPAPFTQFENSHTLNSGVGVFGDTTLTLWDKLDLTAGVRYDYERAHGQIHNHNSIPIPASPAVDDTKDFDNVSPRFEAGYHWTRDWMSYASAARGFKAGGFNSTSPADKVDFGPEKSWTYEIGNKIELFNNRLALNADLFYIDWKNQQLDVPTGSPGVFFIDNVGKSTSKGAELEGTFRATEAWDLFGGVGYTNATFDKYTQTSGSSARNNRLPYAPEITWNAGTQYNIKLQHGMKAFARAEVFGVGRYAYDASNAAQSNAYILTNFRIGVSGEHWRVQGFIDNAFNTHYTPLAFPFAGLAPSGYVGESGAPQVIGITLGFTY